VATLFRVVLVYLKKEGTNLKYLALFIFFLAMIFVSYTGFLGGTLVFTYLVGI